MSSYIKLDTIANIIVQNIINNRKTSVADLVDIKTIEVSEDCISREWVRKNMLKYGFLAPDMTVTEFVADAPSVVPSRAEGEWIDKGDYAECSNCGAKSGTQFNGVEPVPLKTKFCPNCGAKMKEAQTDCDTNCSENPNN